MRKGFSLNMMEPPICPPDGYYRWLNHEQEFSDEIKPDIKKDLVVEVDTPSIVGFAGLFFGIGCLLYTLVSKRRK